MTVTDLERSAFEASRSDIIEITEHLKGCRGENSSIPMNECRCDCYEIQVFVIGYRQCIADINCPRTGD